MASQAQPDTVAATAALQRIGLPINAELVNRYARDAAVLAELQRTTGTAFSGQIGKIGFDNGGAVRQVNAYLNRRIQGQRNQWGKGR